MCADLSHLGGLQDINLDLDNSYPVTQEKSTFRLPPKGRYTLQAPSSFPSAAFSATKEGNLSVQIDPTIVGPTNEGHVIRYTRVSAKTFERNGKIASQVGDYLTAVGFVGNLRTTEQVAEAVESTAGALYEANLDWKAYNKRTGFTLVGMDKFPKMEDGSHQVWTIDPAEVGKVDEQGRQLKVFANVVIPFGGFIPKA